MITYNVLVKFMMLNLYFANYKDTIKISRNVII